MRIISAIMTAIGWVSTIFAIVSALGLGSMHMHFGPLDFRLPVHTR